MIEHFDGQVLGVLAIITILALLFVAALLITLIGLIKAMFE